ncbi:MAG: pectin acetylesterase-family hydrolase [Bacteroidota bacterium]
MLKKIVKAIAILVGAFVLLAVGAYYYLKPDLPPLMSADTTELPDFKWRRIDLGDDLKCSDGTPYQPFVREGTSNNLIIYFSGGGVAWDAHTALNPIDLNTLRTREGYYFKNLSPWIMYSMGGIIEENQPKNPFNDWQFAFIPYATADFHTGNRSVELTANGQRQMIHFNGRTNVTQSLQWFFKHFPKPDKVLICGESAGAFGSTFWTPYIAQHYTGSQLYHFADGAMLSNEKMTSVVDDLWHADWEKQFGHAPQKDLIKGAFLHNAKVLGNQVTYLHFNTLYDEILARYQADINDLPRDNQQHVLDWSAEMLTATAELQAQIPNYYFYLTDYSLDKEKGTTVHTISRNQDFYYQVEEEGILFLDWLSDAVLKDAPRKVGEKFLFTVVGKS